jgi:putative peptidoglycan lipid II flippase
VILPSLSRSHANDSVEEFSHTVDWGLRLVLLVGIPSAVGLFLLARPMIATLFQYGDFGPGDVTMSGLSLMAYAAGLPGFMLVKVLAPAFYSRKDPRTPVRIAIFALLTNMVLNLVFVVPMVLLDIPAPHAGLAFATSLAAWVNAGLLLRTLKNRQIYCPQSGWPRLFLQLGLAAATLAVLLLWAVPAIAAWLQWSAWQRVANLALWVVAGAAIYLLSLHLSGVDLRRFWQQVHSDAAA